MHPKGYSDSGNDLAEYGEIERVHQIEVEQENEWEKNPEPEAEIAVAKLFEFRVKPEYRLD